MLYLLDANVLIDANRDYYPIGRVPEFWEWLEFQASEGTVKVPVEMYEEFKDGKDALGAWARLHRVQRGLVLQEDVDRATVARVVSEGYAADLTDVELVKIGRDPFLIAHCLTGGRARCAVTTEVSRPSRKRGNRKIPDVCRDLGVACCNTFELTRRLDFSTSWRRSR